MKKIITFILTFFLFTLSLNAIENITINNYDLAPRFDKDIKVYNVYTSINTEIITINVIQNEGETITGNGSKSLKKGVNKFEINSYLNNELAKTYTIFVTRGEEADLKDDAHLESVSISNKDIDFEKRTMYIRRSVVKLAQQEPEIKLPKTISSIRQIAIPQALCDILQELKKEQDRKKALLGEKWHEEGFLFTDWCGHVMHPHTPTKQFDKFLKKYGFRHLKFHGLRHSSATYLLSNGCDIKTVSKRLGHTSIDTTNIYVHALERTDKAAAECFDSIEV